MLACLTFPTNLGDNGERKADSAFRAVHVVGRRRAPRSGALVNAPRRSPEVNGEFVRRKWREVQVYQHSFLSGIHAQMKQDVVWPVEVQS